MKEKNEFTQIPEDFDMVSPRYDATFKCIFTKESEEFKEALKDFLSVFLKRKVIEAQVVENELAIESEEDKALRFDINSKIKALADTGFQGIHKFHKNSEIPKKKTKRHPLTKQKKRKIVKSQAKEFQSSMLLDLSKVLKFYLNDTEIVGNVLVAGVI